MRAPQQHFTVLYGIPQKAECDAPQSALYRHRRYTAKCYMLMGYMLLQHMLFMYSTPIHQGPSLAGGAPRTHPHKPVLRAAIACAAVTCNFRYLGSNSPAQAGTWARTSSRPPGCRR